MVAAHLAGVGLVILAMGAAVAAAAKLRGKVTAVTGQDVRIEVEGDLVPQVGDRVDLSFQIPGGPEIPVGEWRVSVVNAAGVQATMVKASGTPTVGQTATIDSATPIRRAASKPEGQPARIPDAGGPGAKSSGGSLVDITESGIQSGRLPDGQGWHRFDGTTLGVQSSPVRNTWYRLSREPAQVLRVTAGLRVLGGSAGRNAAILMSGRTGVNELDEGDVYVGTGHDGTQVEVHRYERNAWHFVASAPSRRAAPDDLVIERESDGYTVQINGTTIGPVAAVPGRADWVRFLVDRGVHAELSAWKVHRLP